MKQMMTPWNVKLFCRSFMRSVMRLCGWFLLFVAASFLLLNAIAVVSSQYRSYVVNNLAQQGGGVYAWHRQNLADVANEGSGKGIVDITTCSNSVEYILRLAERYSDGKEVPEEMAKGWSFVVNVPEDAPDTFPVMFSSNFNPSVIPREWSDEEMRHRGELRIKAIDGAAPRIAGLKKVVVVRNGGAAQILWPKYITVSFMFGKQPYKLAADTYFLTPAGKMWPCDSEENNDD